MSIIESPHLNPQPQDLEIVEIPIDKIDKKAFLRDRNRLLEDDLDELKWSIYRHGQRLPIEVCEAGDGTYQLISGLRRVLAIEEMPQIFGNEEKWTKVRALVRPFHSMSYTLAAMVDENEMRSGVSFFEKARLVYESVRKKHFPNHDDAVLTLFRHSSPAKRSKIRTFAEWYTTADSFLKFGEYLTERKALRLCHALRLADSKVFHEACAQNVVFTPEEEWALLEPLIEEIEQGPIKGTRRGRKPKVPTIGWTNRDTLNLSSGITLQKSRDSHGHVIRIMGRGVTCDTVENIFEAVRYRLEKPD